MGQSRKKNAKYVNELKRKNPIKYANVFAVPGMHDIDKNSPHEDNTMKDKTSKRVK